VTRRGPRSPRAARRSPASKVRTRPATAKTRARTGGTRRSVAGPAPVSAADLRALKRELDRRQAAMRWNPDPEDVQRSVAQLVLTIVEFLRKLMERQAIRRMEQQTLTPKEVEAVGISLMRLEETVRDIGRRFGLAPEDLNLDLGPIGKLM
jgi:hypothetical protein